MVARDLHRNHIEEVVEKALAESGTSLQVTKKFFILLIVVS